VTIAEALRSAEDRLRESDVPEPRRDAALLTAHVLGHDSVYLIAHSEAELAAAEIQQLNDMIQRRAGREPIQYITGHQEFFGLDFKVTPDVLIPRPETEILVERAIKFLEKLDDPRFFEVGVGSGCISISILHSLSRASAAAGDISERALAVARENAKRHSVDERLRLVAADVYDGLGGARFDAVISNPPYVPIRDIESLQAEVRDFEPHVALTDRGDGLSVIRRIIDEAPSHLKAGGLLLVEVGFAQGHAVGQLLDPSVWRSVEFIPDLQGIPRILAASSRS
jgi:release factor glutamine methyltransferase